MFISVIIPTCNRLVLLSKCLDCLRADFQKTENDRYEVIVTDDSKNNKTEKMIADKYQWVTCAKGPQKGPAANRNNGAKSAKGEWLIFLDDDVIPDAGLISEYIKGITDNPDSLAFEGTILPDNEKLLKKDMAECPVNTTGGYFWSANICVNKWLFKQVGGFDESFSIAAQEDQYLYYLLKKQTNIKFLAPAKVTHPVKFIALKNKLKNNITAVSNWALYCSKQSMSKYKIIQQGYAFQCRSLLKNLYFLKIKSAILNCHTLLIALPYFIFKHDK